MKRAIAVSFLLAGCATPYQPESFTGGFHEIQLADGAYQVTFKGNGYTSPSKARDYALLRGAELCLQNGYGQYIVVGVGDETTTHHVVSRSSTYTSGHVDSMGNFHGTTTGGSTTVTPISKPGTSLVIQCANDVDEALSAEVAVKALKAKYQIEP